MQAFNNTWNLMEDKSFSLGVLKRHETAIMDSISRSQEISKLCDECRNLDYQSDEPVLRETLATMRSKVQQCALHSLIYRCIPPSTCNDLEVVHIRRSDSLLVMDKSKIPLLSLSKISENTKKNHLHSDDIHFGLPKLFQPSTALFYGLLRTWIQDCDLHHPQCRPTDRSRFQAPTRLIEVNQVDGGSSKVFLRNAVDAVCLTGGELRYIALSHPWGNGEQHDHFCTTKDNLDSRLNAGIDLNDFPNTFRHAIEVTRSLGIPYLWIDSLCIVQGPGGDFDTEAKRMETVFSSAYCVIAASRANGTSSGFLWERPEREVVRLDGYLAHDPVYVCEAIDNFQHDVIEGALNKRGWVLQERALAPRTIYFTENQTYWECGHGVRCETLARLTNSQASFLGDPNFPKLAMRSTRGAKIRFYESLYRQYSNLDFTKIHDRPIAIAGLEQRLVNAFKTEGGYGVFNGAFFGRSLLWTRDTQRSDGLQLIDFPRDQKFRVPTWSWTAYKGPITYFDIPFDHVRWTYNTAEGRIQSPWTSMESDCTSFSLHTGELDGRIDLTAQAREMLDPESAEAQEKVIYDEGKMSPGVRKLCVIVGHEKPKDEECTIQDVGYYALLIAPSADSSNGSYRRVGVGSRVWSWLNSVEQESFPTEESEHQRKRRKIINTKSDSDSQLHRIPTPPGSSQDSHFGIEANAQTPHSMPRKRRRSTHDQGLVHSDEDGAVEDTPRASSRGLRQGVPGLDHESSTSYASSGVSGTSSPTKQLRYAATQKTGFDDFKFDDFMDQLPPSLQDLHQQLLTIGYGFGLIPQTLKPQLQGLRNIPEFAFYDPDKHASSWRIPPPSFIRQVLQSATKCEFGRHSEASWNMEVHRCVLDFAFREANDASVGDYRYCTTAHIIPEYKPFGTSSKCVDFCICVETPKESLERQKIDDAIKTRPGLSINHTDWGDLCKNPIALSIETKRQVSWEKALLQIGTWHAAQWRSLRGNIEAIEFQAGIIVQDHDWFFVASTLQDGKSTTYHRLPLGSTYNAFDLYKLLMSLQCLGAWIKDKYWPAFRKDMLKIFDVEQ
ncbi:CAMK CAMK1 kinase [Fusarium napiforme]|uniref:CAMK CAMK1 kinase n=1 Tax=Fusarium napiforme TaxID=42672 RepID=A0A8H5JRM2_9HYPO|nr:CAMK CAMK1 kinase [Fusarium napiforme]